MDKHDILKTYSYNFYAQGELPQGEIWVEEIVLKGSEPLMKIENIQFLCFIAGTGCLKVNGADLQVCPGDVARLFPYHIYSIAAAAGETLEFYRCSFPLSLLLYMDRQKREADEIVTLLEQVNPVLSMEERQGRRIRQALEEIMEERGHQRPYSKDVMLGALTTITALYNRQAVLTAQKDQPQERSLGWQALQHIQMHFNADGMEAAKVAEHLRTDVRRLGHVLRMLTGQGFSANLHEARIRNACAMMGFEELSIAFIARYVGYDSPATFHREFRKVKGVTPHEHRVKAAAFAPQGHRRDSAWQIITYMLENYGEELNPALVAEKLFLSERTLSDILHSNFALGFGEILEQIRIAYAQALLGASQLLIYDIAITVGFNSIRTFTRSFKNQTGTTPSQYRKHILKTGVCKNIE